MTLDGVYLGRFDTAELAAAAHDKAVRKMWGPDASFNFPFPGERSARPGIESQEWDLPDVQLRDPTKPRALNRSGHTGASFCRQNSKWYASIKINGKSCNLGYYNTPEEAHAVYKQRKLNRKVG